MTLYRVLVQFPTAAGFCTVQTRARSAAGAVAQTAQQLAAPLALGAKPWTPFAQA